MNRDNCVDYIGRLRYPGDLYSIESNFRNQEYSILLRISLTNGRAVLPSGLISHTGSGKKYYSGTYIYFSQVDR